MSDNDYGSDCNADNGGQLQPNDFNRQNSYYQPNYVRTDMYIQQYEQYAPYTEKYPEQDKNDGLAVASLVLGILSLFCCGIVTGLVGVILGIISFGKKRQNNSMAVVGIGLSVIGMIFSAIVISLLIFTGSFEFSYYLG